MIETIRWKDNRVLMIDQRKLPREEKYFVCANYRSVINAIRRMVIRGAPAIGVAAAMGVALGARSVRTKRIDLFQERLSRICEEIKAARPTAVNLAWAVERMERLVADHRSEGADAIKTILFRESEEMLKQDIRTNRSIGRHGQALLKDGDCVLTHCNAGALATGGYGTALGVIRAAVEKGKKIRVLADETRPFLQGARLTAWEMMKSDIPVTLITDNMSGHLMYRGEVNAVIVGADRIAANGDVANKIGTYMVAVLARTHDIPFYVAAPLSSIDRDTPTGDQIPIEERPPEEVTHFQGKRIAPDGVAVKNPAFDVTPNRNISGIITEKGIALPPFGSSLAEMF
ncbi:MAG: S-methyl-5-thioribose-1-phosphate isomerase [Deltaproteobacteria bacterium]|jgi:methylthioribose-1-phosphate isomerase|nr:S-methyl-5-thioribose-1-phosphate isomerase [Deltaproteobacteria bacterium]